MNTKITDAQHASTAEKPLHLRLRSRALAGITAGCLALTLCPTAAIAAPMDMGQQAGGQGGAPAMEQQLDQQGQQPFDASQAPLDSQVPADGQQAPGGQEFGGQPMNSAFDDQIRQYLQDTFNITAFLPNDQSSSDGAQAAGAEGFQAQQFQLGAPGEAPEIPEGEINVQAVIDSVHDIIRQYGVEALESADFSDADFQAKLAEYVKTAMQERLDMFHSGTTPGNMDQPSDLPAPDEANASASNQALDQAQPMTPDQAADATQLSTGQAAQDASALSSTLLGSIINFIVGLF